MHEWIREHKWRLLLVGIVALLAISPISEIFDEQDNVITPLTGLMLLAVIFGTAENKWVIRFLSTFTLVWVVVGLVTDGSGLFTNIAIVAPVLFVILLAAIFLLLARWMVRATHVSIEVICAAICGYLLLGIFWMCLYAIAAKFVPLSNPRDPFAFTSTVAPNVHLAFGDMLYFSFTTLTTTAFGDIVPHAPVVRMLSVLEAMAGLFYNTIIIARLVSLYGTRVRETARS
jgi:hypothetical protein